MCNLTTVNVNAFVHTTDEGKTWLDVPGLFQTQAMSVRAGMRMTLLELELPEWNKMHHRDRLIGTSLTGWQDAINKLGLEVDEQNGLLMQLKEVAFTEAIRYANTLRIPVPLLTTTIKPEGTLSQVAGGVSSGLHVAHSPFYIRRVRINASDPLASVALNLGWNVFAEVGTKYKGKKIYDIESLADKKVIKVAKSLVIEFPVKSGSNQKSSQTVKSQFETYFNFQKYYTAHNSSNTITVKDDEWDEVLNIIIEEWDNFVGVSFIPESGGVYTLMPYEEITEEEYNTRVNEMKEFNIEDLYAIEKHENKVELIDDCKDGA